MSLYLDLKAVHGARTRAQHRVHDASGRRLWV